MTQVTLFTDPHLGVSRQSHTTRASSARLQERLFNAAMAVVSTGEHPKICLGDLFDEAFNKERIIAQGIQVATRCQMTLSGNHDETNREGTITSLQVVKEAGASVCISEDLSRPYFDSFANGIYMVPHHASQELFLAACFEAAQHAAQYRDGLASFLMLHCNYNFGLAVTDNTLNLPEDVAKQLLDAFDLIFIGHEHKPSTHLDGRVVILGNTHPTSFADISDKYVYHLDLETAEYTRECIWNESNHYREIKFGSEVNPRDLEGIHFIDVVGQEAIGDAAAVNDFINSIWEKAKFEVPDVEGAFSDLLAVRNRVALKDSLEGLDTSAEEVQLEDLETRMRNDLHGSDLAELFEELLAEVKA